MPYTRSFSKPYKRYNYKRTNYTTKPKRPRINTSKGTEKDYKAYIQRALKQKDQALIVRWEQQNLGWAYGLGTLFSASTSAITFNMNDLPNMNEISDAWDYIKLDHVILHVMCPFDAQLPAAGNVFVTVPNLFYCVDLDDNNVPSTQAVFLQRPNLKIKRMDRVIKIRLSPRMTNLVSKGGPITVGTETRITTDFKDNQWLSTTNINTLHYGVKTHVESSASSQILTPVNGPDIPMFIEYHMRVRGRK